MVMIAVVNRVGIIVSVYIFLIWMVCLTAIIISRPAVSAAFFAINVLTAAIGAKGFVNMKDDLVFRTDYSRAFAIPPSDIVDRLVLIFNLLVIFIFLVPSEIVLLYKPKSLETFKDYLMMSACYFIGLIGLLGLFTQYFNQKLKSRQVEVD